MFTVLRYVTIFIVGGVPALPALAQSTPPLLPGEVYVQTQNGCGIISAPKDVEKFKKEISELTWTGSCPNGLANGMGQLGKPPDFQYVSKSEYAYGRKLGKSIPPTIQGGGLGRISYSVGGRHAYIPNLTNPFSPRWIDVEKGGGTFLTDMDKNRVNTHLSNCFIDQGAFDGCDLGNQFQVYGITVKNKSDSKDVTTWCPDPKTSNGCEALWQEKSGPIVARIKAFIEEVEKKTAEDKRKYAELTLPWIEKEGARKVADAAEANRVAAEAKANQLAAEAETKRQAVLKGIAREKDREVAAIEQQERDELDAKEKEKAEKAFQASLSKLNAGELYALADTKRNEGEMDKAREILRTLITKFPNNPLVALAAQQMSQIKPSAPAAAPATPKPPTPAAQNKATNRDAGLEEMAGAFNAPKK
jgi:hypothetical protein